MSSTYIIKEIEKLVSCVYGAIQHSGNVGRTLEKRVKHSATPRVLHASLVFPQHSPRALSRHKRTRLVFYFIRFKFSNFFYVQYTANSKKVVLCIPSTLNHKL
jgi:hypothetical protein